MGDMEHHDFAAGFSQEYRNLLIRTERNLMESRRRGR